MQFNRRSQRLIADTVRSQQSKPIRTPAKADPHLLPTRVHWATITQSITAANGLQKGSGVVSLLCDDTSGTGLDKVIQTNVKVWNGFQMQYDPPSSSSKVRRVLIGVVDGLLQVLDVDCPVT